MLQNSIAWGGFLAVSSNTRYQLVAGIEERILVSVAGESCLRSHAISAVVWMGHGCVATAS